MNCYKFHEAFAFKIEETFSLVPCINRNLTPQFVSLFRNLFLKTQQDGPNTWPITAMTYIYVKKDLTFIEDPASQSLLKAFLKAVYSDEYIEQCEEQFGFVRVGGALRDMALASIDALITDPTAPEWTFETDTIKRIGQGDYVISQKRKSYSEIEQEKLVETIEKLADQIAALQAQVNSAPGPAVSSPAQSTPMTSSDSNAQAITTDSELMGDGMDEDDQVMAALVMSSISIALWVAAIIGFFLKKATTDTGRVEKKTEDMMMVN